VNVIEIQEMGDGGREYRVAMINSKKFPASLSITTISVEELFPEHVFLLDTGAELNFIKQEVYTQTRKFLGKISCILLVTDGFIETFGSV